MSGTQRLRLVLALGVVNLVLATVALGYGLVRTGSDPGRRRRPDRRDGVRDHDPDRAERRQPDAVADRSGREPDTRRAPSVRESG